jgi:hypothetical protein
MSRSRENHVCPIMKKTCIGCSIYRGRHVGLWTDEKPARAATAPSNGNGSDWVASPLDNFLDDMAAVLEGKVIDCD